jgi:hypothetical protein
MLSLLILHMKIMFLQLTICHHFLPMLMEGKQSSGYINGRNGQYGGEWLIATHRSSLSSPALDI